MSLAAALAFVVTAVLFDRASVRLDRLSAAWWAAKLGVFVSGLVAVVAVVGALGVVVVTPWTYR